MVTRRHFIWKYRNGGGGSLTAEEEANFCIDYAEGYLEYREWLQHLAESRELTVFAGLEARGYFEHAAD